MPAHFSDLPDFYREIAEAYDRALADQAGFPDLQTAIAARDTGRTKALWNPLVAAWDEKTFYDFVTGSKAFQRLSFRHREVFGQVGFGTGGWDSDFPNPMLEILRVNLLGLDDDQHFVIGGVAQVLKRLWQSEPPCAHWPEGTSLSSLNGGAAPFARHRDQPGARRPDHGDGSVGQSGRLRRRSGHLSKPPADHRHLCGRGTF